MDRGKSTVFRRGCASKPARYASVMCWESRMKRIFAAFIFLLSPIALTRPYDFGDSYEGWDDSVTLPEMVGGLIAWAALIWLARWVFEKWTLGWWGVAGFYLMHVLMFYVMSGLSQPLWSIAIISVFATIFSLVVLNEL